jgi:hypothetical protein
LSWKNHLTRTAWKRVRTGLGKLAPELERCPVVADNFAIMDEVSRDAQANANNRELAGLIALQVARIR